MAISAEYDGIFKDWYTDHPIGDGFFRNSPVGKMIPKTEVGGDKYIVPLILGNGGGGAADLVVANAIALANGAGNNQQFAVTYGNIFATFNVLVQDMLASRMVRGAFVPVAVLRMFQGLDVFRKIFATCLYGTGFGEIGQAAPTGSGIVPGLITQGATNTIVVPTSYTYKMSVGSQLVYTNGATPGSTLRNVVSTVTKIGTPTGSGASQVSTITVSSAAGTNFTPAATDWIELNGFRISGAAAGPVGLPAWLPYTRSGLATPFYGVDRSVNEPAGAGNYIQRDTPNNEKNIDAVTRGVAAVRAGGGSPDFLIASPNRWAAMAAELQSQAQYWQTINSGSDAKKSNQVARGIEQMSFIFSSSWVGEVVDDPYCPDNIGWIIQKDTLEFAALTNSESPLNDGVSGNEPGKQSASQIGDPDLSYKYISENYLTINPGADAQQGPTVKVTINMFGNFAVHDPIKCAVINFVS
jgi:hypothetical protein